MTIRLRIDTWSRETRCLRSPQPNDRRKRTASSRANFRNESFAFFAKSLQTVRLNNFPMQIFHKLEDVPANFGPTLLTVGNFDGVHRAHTHVLDELARRAKQQNAKAMAVTFEPHPMRICGPIPD